MNQFGKQNNTNDLFRYIKLSLYADLIHSSVDFDYFLKQLSGKHSLMCLILVLYLQLEALHQLNVPSGVYDKMKNQLDKEVKAILDASNELNDNKDNYPFGPTGPSID